MHHETDTLANYLAWKIEFKSLETTNRVTENLHIPISKIVHKEISHQLTQHAITIRIPDLQEMKDWELEMQKHICTLTDTITKLFEQVTKLATRTANTTATSTIRPVVASPQTHRLPTTYAKPPMAATPTYVQIAEKKKLQEFTEVKGKKKDRKETVLPKSYPTADRLVIFNLTTAPNNRKETADRALQVVNKAITSHSDIEHPPFILANITATNNLIFTVIPQHISTT